MTRRRERVAVIVYPVDPNPYQRLLYDAIQQGDVNVAIRWVRRRRHLGPLPFFVGVTMARVCGFRTIHIHWTQFALRRSEHTLYRLSLINARVSMSWLNILGIRIVWTVHNVIPHERETADDVMVARGLASAASRKIVHSKEVIGELEAIGADADRVSVIPHGAYTDTYAKVDRLEARRSLQLPVAARTALFFGQIRPYKGVEDLVESWREITGVAPESTVAPFLLLAGKCGDPSQQHKLERAVSAVRGRFDAGYQVDEKVPAYFAAADFAVLPFRAVTTSGSAMLALSLGCPIVAPRLGSLRDLPEEVGFFYEPNGLSDALRRAIGASDAELALRSDAARRYARGISWGQIAASTLDLYRQVADDGRKCGSRAGRRVRRAN